jgi:hypothetical protein
VHLIFANGGIVNPASFTLAAFGLQDLDPDTRNLFQLQIAVVLRFS